MSYFLLFIFASVIVFISYTIFDVSASPSFPRQVEFDTQQNDWKYFPIFSGSNCTEVQNSLPKIPELEAVTYLSDGHYLNVTFWLSGPFHEIPLPIYRIPIYSAAIGIVQPYDTTITSDYASSIQWNLTSLTWTRTIDEYLGNQTRSIIQDKNYTNFFGNIANKGYVTLPIDLRKIGSPNEYALIFQISDWAAAKGNFCGIKDIISRAVYIPFPKFKTSSSPNPLEITQGEEKDLELKITSNALVNSIFTLKAPNVPHGMEIDITPNETHIAPAGISTPILNVKTSSEVIPRSYTIPVYPTISFPLTFDVSPFSGSLINIFEDKARMLNMTASIEKNGNMVLGDDKISSIDFNPRASSFSVIVKPQPTPQEQFESFWSAYGGFVSLSVGGLVGGFSTLLIERLKNRSKSNSKN